jgi:hypothetical protein
MPPPMKQKATSEAQHTVIDATTPNRTEKPMLTCVLVASVFATTFHTAGGCAAKHGVPNGTRKHLVHSNECVHMDPGIYDWRTIT